MQYYTYKVTFKDLPCYFYYGKHKDDGKPYFGSPVTWARLWKHFEPEIQILQWYATEGEVRRAEKSIIRATWKDKYSLNENVGGCFSEEACRKQPRGTRVASGRKNGQANVGAMNDHPNTAANRSALGRITVATMNDHPNTAANRKANGRATGAVNVSKMPKETLVAGGKASGKANLTKLNSQKWQCLVTGHVANPGNLSKYQKARGIDTSMRIKLQ
jgi:hypothetical protein